MTMQLGRILIFVSLLSLIYSTGDLRQQFKEWKLEYHRNYGGALHNELTRFKQFRRSAETIDYINSIQNDWKAGFTQFADMSDAEKSSFMGIHLNETAEERVHNEPSLGFDASDPAKQYWEMGPVENQWTCGSCWAFAASGALEGWHIKEHGEFRDFSEQTLLDCTFEGSRDGCKGGWSSSAVRWAGWYSPVVVDGKHGYLPYRVDNPYKGKDRDCVDTKKPYENGLKRARPNAWAEYKDRTDAGLQHALATQGPIIVYIYSSWALPFYTTGTYKGTGCSSTSTSNHAVVVAGYEKDYWYIKNSWGSGWGYSGYVYFTRQYENLCEIARHRHTISWNPNDSYDVCTDTHPRERTPCVDDRILDETDCLARGCCYDPNHLNTKNQCFAKGKITVYDTEGHRRVFYGSVPDFTDVGFPWQASSVQVESGTWIVYGKGDYWNLPSKVLTAEDGKVTMGVASARIITSKLALHLFEYSDFLGDVYTVSQYNDNIPKLNNDVSSYISFGSPWELCDDTNQRGKCELVPSGTESKQSRTMTVCDDCVSSIA